MEPPILPSSGNSGSPWRGPTVAEIARESGVGTATVDRVLNARGNVRAVTRDRVLTALERLRKPVTNTSQPVQRRVAFITESGVSFNQTLETAVGEIAAGLSGVECPFTSIASANLEPVKFANLIERSAEDADALIVVARENLMISRAIRNVVARKVPVICLTTDLPTSGRAAYVGSDQTGAGSAAAYLMGQLAGAQTGKILLVYSAPYRAQEERELGFRRVLRSEFSRLEIDDRVNSNDDSEHSFRHVTKYIEDHGAPVGIYNTVGGNLGIGRALAEHGLAGKTVFIGHELNPNSRHLLETGVMNFAIGHDVQLEVELAIQHAIALIENRDTAPPPFTRVRIYTKYNCI